jgi:DNA-binding IclR family transcriptional regulator
VKVKEMIQSVERAFKILEMMNDLEVHKKGLGGLEISKRLGLKHPTVHNFLKTLSQLGYVQQDPDTSKFRLGEKALHLGLNLLNAESLVHIVGPVLKVLSRTIEETTLLILFDQGMRNTLIVEESPKPVKISVSSTIDDNFYSTATGRVLLANMDDKELDRFIEEHPLRTGMNVAPSTLKEIPEIIARIRKHGYEMIEKDFLTVIGVPLVNKATNLNATLGTYFAGNGTIGKERKQFIISELKKASLRIINQLNKNGKKT